LEFKDNNIWGILSKKMMYVIFFRAECL